MEEIRVVISGACGKMGKAIIKGIMKAEGFKIVGAVDICDIGRDLGDLVGSRPIGIKVTGSLQELLPGLEKPLVVIDFTHRDAARVNIPQALNHGASVVMGTTGLSQDDIRTFARLAEENGVGIMIAPNFSLGAVLMMKAAREISRYLNQAEIIEYHNDMKVDSPSGTAISTALGMKDNISKSNRDEKPARGADYGGIRIHSVRLNSLIAHQEVLFSGYGELLTIRHDSFSRESFLPGIIMAARMVGSWQGLKYGLDSIMEEDSR